MQFVIIGLDGTDPEAPDRRQAARPGHIAGGVKLREAGKLFWGSALLNDDGTMKGSLYVVNFGDRSELDKWLETEPYVLGDVWQHITIHSSTTNEPWQFSHDQAWFEKYAV